MPDSPNPVDNSQTPASWNRGEMVPWWLVIVVLVLLVAVVGLGSFMLYARFASTNSANATVTEIERWEAEVNADPTNAKSIVALGYAYQKQGRYQDAIQSYNSAIGLQPTNIGALYNRGVCLMELGRAAEAEQSLRKVLEIAPQHALAAAALGQYYLDTRQYEKIAPAVEKASAANPQLADLHALLGISFEQAGRTKEAIGEYKAALELSPELPLAEEGLARLKGQ